MKVEVRAKNSSSGLGWPTSPPPHLFALHLWEYLLHVCKLSFFTESATTSAPLYWLQVWLKEFLTHPKYFTKCRTMLDDHSYNKRQVVVCLWNINSARPSFAFNQQPARLGGFVLYQHILSSWKLIVTLLWKLQHIGATQASGSYLKDNKTVLGLSWKTFLNSPSSGKVSLEKSLRH